MKVKSGFTPPATQHMEANYRIPICNSNSRWALIRVQ